MSDREQCPYTEADIGQTFTVPPFGDGTLLSLRPINGLGDWAVGSERAAAIAAVFRTPQGGHFTMRYLPGSEQGKE